MKLDNYRIHQLKCSKNINNDDKNKFCVVSFAHVV